ncbi:hypothetical protein M438DRAFT_2290 [Aureobasidium pullulans EXF-150]|uniref:Uncharacterized protein n=1 Tax=Aureobasidium pullulans EXF-150 TaxID=1043002 RepID=A0A074XZW3_AURPU|nr:uncharacterized protein M438DRAFT_2290 [Aureobasidium pullulans EXF-150]KEQ89179.1 hypothetical protein M438DRAFT_2290 [Aureobasidium pullulans EXF-150]
MTLHTRGWRWLFHDINEVEGTKRNTRRTHFTLSLLHFFIWVVLPMATHCWIAFTLFSSLLYLLLRIVLADLTYPFSFHELTFL